MIFIQFIEGTIQRFIIQGGIQLRFSAISGEIPNKTQVKPSLIYI